MEHPGKKGWALPLSKSTAIHDPFLIHSISLGSPRTQIRSSLVSHSEHPQTQRILSRLQERLPRLPAFYHLGKKPCPELRVLVPAYPSCSGLWSDEPGRPSPNKNNPLPTEIHGIQIPFAPLPDWLRLPLSNLRYKELQAGASSPRRGLSKYPDAAFSKT